MMPERPNPRRRRWTTLGLIVALGVLVAAAALEHTDDGCVLETHCAVCHWQRGATVVPTLVAPLAAPVDLGHARSGVVETPRLAGVLLETTSRGPPLA